MADEANMEFKQTMDDTNQSFSVLGWAAWLTEQEKATKEAYKRKPAFLIADFNRERANMRDYQGREILELLQNANDAGAEAGEPSRIVIELSQQGLIVGNTGRTFSPDGITSLENSNLSPKRFRRRRMIGNKGLGFRAVLNWSLSPIILSGELALVFDRKYAEEMVRQMMTDSMELSHLVQEEEKAIGQLPVPVLTFPAFCESGDLTNIIKSTNTLDILHRCQKLRDCGIDTVIGMPFNQPEAYSIAKSQIAELTPEFLLFVRYIQQVSVIQPDTSEVRWTSKADDDTIRINSCERWAEYQVYKQAGVIPHDVRTNTSDSEQEYELIVAVPTQVKKEPSILYSFFPTEVNLPQGVLCHATLDLEQNRKHPQQGKENTFVLSQLAIFLAEVAEQRARSGSIHPWSGIDLLIPHATYSSDLRRVHFDERIIEAARSRAIVPTLSGITVYPHQARLIDADDVNWLPIELFPNVVATRDGDDISFVKKLDVPKLTPEEFKNIIVESDRLSIEKRADLIAGMVRYRLPENTHTPSLLLDTAGEFIPEDSRVFIQSTDSKPLTLPKWADVRFLHLELRQALASRLDLRDTRQFYQKLNSFRLVEYSLDSLASSLVAANNRRVKESPHLAEQFDRELLQLLFELFPYDQPEEKRPKFPAEASVRLPTQSTNWTDARKVYFGRGYTISGPIVQDLFRGAPEKLVVEPTGLQLTEDVSKLAVFLQWIGVAQWPRYNEETNVNREFVSYTLDALTYPVQFDDRIYHDSQQVPLPSISNARSVDSLGRILQTGDPFAIVAWLAMDERAIGWQRSGTEHGRLRCQPPHVQYLRVYSGVVPSYIGWTLQNTAWLPSTNHILLRPCDCMIGDRNIERLFPGPLMPSPDLLEQYGLPLSAFRLGLQHAGVGLGLSTLSSEDIYKLLLELPGQSPDGHLARAFYRWLLDVDYTALRSGGANQVEFFKQGKMWGCYQDTQGYYPVSTLCHADTEDIPTALLRSLKTVDLPRRVGSQKVERLFGIQPVNKENIQIQLLHSQLDVGSTQANEDFNATKPYLFALRQSQSTRTQDLLRLKNLKLEICSQLTASIVYEMVQFDHEYLPYEWLILNDTIYVRSNPSEDVSITNPLLADTIGSALASLFGLTDGGNFTLLLTCDPSARRFLVQRRNGEGTDEEITKAIEAFAIHDSKETFLLNIPSKSDSSDHEQKLIQTDSPSRTMQEGDDKLIDQQPEDQAPTRLNIEEHNAVVCPSRHPIRLRIQRSTTSDTITWSHRKNLVDWQFCEKKAMEFELASDPPRFPVSVAKITGYAAPGCDIISFESETDRHNFIASEQKEASLIVRFIEVKGRAHERATIDLKGNELSAAERYGERYFLYRLFEASKEEFILAVLQNPLRAQEAVKRSIEVSLERARSTQQFVLKGGLRKKEHAKWDGRSLQSQEDE